MNLGAVIKSAGYDTLLYGRPGPGTDKSSLRIKYEEKWIEETQKGAKPRPDIQSGPFKGVRRRFANFAHVDYGSEGSWTTPDTIRTTSAKSITKYNGV